MYTSDKSAFLLLLHVLVFLDLFLTAGLKEVGTKQAVEQNNIHEGHNGHTHAPHCVAEKRNVITVQHQPARHPRQSVDAEHHVCAQVNHAIYTVHSALGNTGHPQHLPEVQEDGIDLHKQGHNREAHVTTRQDWQAKASDHLFEKNKQI